MAAMRSRGIGRTGSSLLSVMAVVVLAGTPAAAATPRAADFDGSSTTTLSTSAQAPAITFTRLGQLGLQGIPITVSWPAATPDGAAIARYDLERSHDGDPWSPVALSKPLARSIKLKVPAWTVFRFRVRAVDTAEVVGSWAESEPRWITVAQESDPAINLSSGWSPVTDSAAYGRRRATTTTSGETATYGFVGREVAWVGRLGPDRGEASVSVDGGAGSITDLSRVKASSRRIVYRQVWATAGHHTLALTATSPGTAVDVDAFLVITDPTEGTLVGAGDIAACTHTRDSETGNLVAGVLTADDSAIAYTVGDNVYPNGGAQYFADCYDPAWGAFSLRTRPTIGNHDYYNNPGAAPYFAYFGANAGVPGEGWYRYEAGTWRVYSLNSECTTTSACYATQLNWLRADLAAEPHRCVMAMWHRPLFSTGSHGPSSRMSDFYQALYDAGADVVLAGHDHGYQRFAPADPSGVPDAVRGMRQFVVGTGGASLYAWKTESSLIEVRDNTTYGVLRLDLSPGGYAWEFLPIPGATAFADTGAATCH